MTRSIIYDPVPSWRLGRSLGIDMLSTRGKTCSFNCIYCQLGHTVYPLTERKELVSLTILKENLNKVHGIDIDYATFSGVGEPTLASNLGDAIDMVKSVLRVPVAVLTNSSLIMQKDVHRDLKMADVVVAKLDAPDERLFHEINRPCRGQKLQEIIAGLKCFRQEYSDTLALQIMFVEANYGYAAEMAKIAKQLSLDEVQLNTPLRPCAVKPLDAQQMIVIREAFSGIKNVVSVYEASRPEVLPLDLEDTKLRRPVL